MPPRPLFYPLLSMALGALAAFACEGDDRVEPRYYQGTLCSETAAGDLFEQRIAPLLADDRPSSCNECHLSGVDLAMFVRDTPCQTFACLVEQGLVDEGDPKASRVLAFIERANPESPLITQAVIDEEYDGFLEWIEFNAACGSAACGETTCDSPHEAFCETAAEPDEEEVRNAERPSGCSDKDIEQLFNDSVYSSRGRCAPCHFDNWENNTLGAPLWIHTGGTCNQASLATLRAIEHAGYLDTGTPEQSLLLTKPLGPEQGGVAHGGGAKFHEGDSAFLNFTRFVEHYSACKRGVFDAAAPRDASDQD